MSSPINRRARSLNELTIGLVEQLEPRILLSGLTVTGPATPIIAGEHFTVTVHADDTSLAGKTVKLKVASGNGALGGQKSAKLDANGDASFNVLLKKQSTYTLKAVEGKKVNGVSDAFTVNAGAAAHLKIVSVFPNTQRIIPHGILGPVVVKVTDAFGNLVTNSIAQLPLLAAGTGFSTTGTLNIGDVITEVRGNATVATGIWLGSTDGNFNIQVTSGAFGSGNITDTTTGATLTNTGNANVTTATGANITLQINTTIGTTPAPTISNPTVQAFSATQATANGTTTFSNLTNAANGNSTTWTHGYYTLFVSAPGFKTQHMRVFVR